MDFAEKEYKKSKNNKKVSKKVEAKPEWFGKNITESKATDEEIKEMKELLKEYQ